MIDRSAGRGRECRRGRRSRRASRPCRPWCRPARPTARPASDRSASSPEPQGHRGHLAQVRRHRLDHRPHGGDDDGRVAGRVLLGVGDAAQGRQPAADRVGPRRQPLVRQRLPGREQRDVVVADQVTDRRRPRPPPPGRSRSPAAPGHRDPADPGKAVGQRRGHERPDRRRPGDPMGDRAGRRSRSSAKNGSANAAVSRPRSAPELTCQTLLSITLLTPETPRRSDEGLTGQPTRRRRTPVTASGAANRPPQHRARSASRPEGRPVMRRCPGDPPWCNGSTLDFGSNGSGSNPGGGADCPRLTRRSESAACQRVTLSVARQHSAVAAGSGAAAVAGLPSDPGSPVAVVGPPFGVVDEPARTPRSHFAGGMSCAPRVIRPDFDTRNRIPAAMSSCRRHRAGRRRRHPNEVEPAEGAARARRQADALACAALRRRAVAHPAGGRTRSRPRRGRASSSPSRRDLPTVVTAIQDQQLGTGHACACALEVTGDLTGTVLVTYGDVPLLQTATLDARSPTSTRPAATR